MRGAYIFFQSGKNCLEPIRVVCIFGAMRGAERETCWNVEIGFLGFRGVKQGGILHDIPILDDFAVDVVKPFALEVADGCVGWAE